MILVFVFYISLRGLGSFIFLENRVFEINRLYYEGSLVFSFFICVAMGVVNVGFGENYEIFDLESLNLG